MKTIICTTPNAKLISVDEHLKIKRDDTHIYVSEIAELPVIFRDPEKKRIEIVFSTIDCYFVGLTIPQGTLKTLTYIEIDEGGQ